MPEYELEDETREFTLDMPIEKVQNHFIIADKPLKRKELHEDDEISFSEATTEHPPISKRARTSLLGYASLTSITDKLAYTGQG